MDLRIQTSLIAALLSLALATSVLLRPRKVRVHWTFGLFGMNVGLWYLTTFLSRLFGGPFWARLNLLMAVLVPLSAVQFFLAFVGEEQHRRMTLLNRAAYVSAALIVATIPTPLHDTFVVATAIFLYVAVFLFASLALLYGRATSATSRFDRARLRYLTLVGALAATFTVFEYLPLVGLDIPPVGTILILIFLYVLSQSIVRYRLLDLYELAGRLGVLTALSFALATVLWVLVYFAGGRFFLHAVVSSLAVLVLFDPIRGKVGDKISQFFFRERYDLEQAIHALRRRIAHVLELDELVRILLGGLEDSRRVTHAAVYLADREVRGYNLAGHVGPEPLPRLEIAPARPLLDRLGRDGAIVLEQLERDLLERRELGEDREAETLYEVVQSMGALHASVCLAIQGERGELYGFLCVRDDRMRDAFSPEEVQLLAGLAVQAGIAVENSRLYQDMKERDRLAALGEMAAGLAHEIRNPLGAIKASAQYLTDSPDDAGVDREFLDIIVEEVDRLNRVVSSFLDYARPGKGDPAPSDVNGVIQRTMQLLRPECEAAAVDVELALDPSLPRVRIDVEHLRQVLLNLVQNALQAMEDGGRVTVQTAARVRTELGGVERRFAELRVEDTGPGIAAHVRDTLFVPFVTTKDRGTGLGLAICQRIVSAAGGTIEVRSHVGAGTTFLVLLPASEEQATTSSPGDVEAGLEAPDQRPSSVSAGSRKSESGSGSTESISGSGDLVAAGPGDRASVLTTSR